MIFEKNDFHFVQNWGSGLFRGSKLAHRHLLQLLWTILNCQKILTSAYELACRE